VSSDPRSVDARTLRSDDGFPRGCTALHFACAYGHEPVVLALLEARAPHGARALYGLTPLHALALSPDPQLSVDHLVQARADVNEVMRWPLSLTPLQSATFMNNAGLVEALVAAFADVGVKTTGWWGVNHTAQDMAESMDRNTILAALEEDDDG